MPSQKGQDKWVLKVLNDKKKGFFVELGAGNGIEISNTCMLERKYEWTGICIEPNPGMYKKLCKERKCICVPECVDDEAHEVEFCFRGGMGGGIIGKDTDNNPQHRGAHIAAARKSAQSKKLKTVTLEYILLKFNAPKVIDYLSLDVEGAEERVLKNFPFDKYIFLTMTIERPSPELNALLFKHGYIFVKNHQFDTFYVHYTLPGAKKLAGEFQQVPPKYKRK